MATSLLLRPTSPSSGTQPHSVRGYRPEGHSADRADRRVPLSFRRRFGRNATARSAAGLGLCRLSWMKVHDRAELREVCFPIADRAVQATQRRGVYDQNLIPTSWCDCALRVGASVAHELANGFDLDHPNLLITLDAVAHRRGDRESVSAAHGLGDLDRTAVPSRRRLGDSPQLLLKGWIGTATDC